MKNRLLVLVLCFASSLLVAMEQSPRQTFRTITPPPAPQLDPCEVKKEAVRRVDALRDAMEKVEQASQVARDDKDRLCKAVACACSYVHTAQIGSITASQCLQTLVYDAQELLCRVNFRRGAVNFVSEVPAENSDSLDWPLRRIRDRSPSLRRRDSDLLVTRAVQEVDVLPEIRSLSLSEELSRDFYQTRYEELYDRFHAVLAHAERASADDQELKLICNAANTYAHEAGDLPGFPNGFFSIAYDVERLLSEK
ncbi:hypothetical protein CVU75_02035 [Candidatus Dependentiae bacterium HGW-Dependentiae-1]|nr:MAG: hypothetical protein CVU75_02035 [Candidatus Dependentiae bacterium HGW-Dependentiae-1]